MVVVVIEFQTGTWTGILCASRGRLVPSLNGGQPDSCSGSSCCDGGCTLQNNEVRSATRDCTAWCVPDVHCSVPFLLPASGAFSFTTPIRFDTDIRGNFPASQSNSHYWEGDGRASVQAGSSVDRRSMTWD